MPLTLSRLVDTLPNDNEQPDDYGEVAVTVPIFKLAYWLVMQAEAVSGIDISGHPVVTSDGGLRVTWNKDNFNCVKLVIPNVPDKKPYIYTQLQCDMNMPTTDSVDNLAQALSKLKA